MVNSSANEQEHNVLRLKGDIDLEHAPLVRKNLLDAIQQGITLFVDLSEVTYIDSSGIACLVEALQTARSNSGDLGLVSVSTQAMRVLELARLDMVFAIHDNLDSALTAGA